MKSIYLVILGVLLIFSMTNTIAQELHLHLVKAVPTGHVQIHDDFWSPKLKIWREVTIDDCFTKFENDRGGAINNFDRVRDKKTGGHAGPAWYDGLIYEMITGAADYLQANPNDALKNRIDGYIVRIAAAQEVSPDGYLNTWTQLMEPDHRWGLNGGNDVNQHDIYNAGCLFEAGIHYYRATGKKDLLKIAVKMANLIGQEIGPAPKKNVVPGHAIIEETLVQLYQLFVEQPELKFSLGLPVNESSYLKLAEFFIEARGHYEGRKSFLAYDQDHLPVFEQPTIEGHAVRATLMANGVAAIAKANGRKDYSDTAVRLWENMTGRKLYITGGVGATANGEAFGPDYELPNNGYLETCAAIGVAFFSHQLNTAFADARYVDEMETVLYNGALGHISAMGTNYSYENPLLFHRGHSRWKWHECPCCPPMFLKLTGALPSYIYAQDDQSIYVNLFIGSTAAIRMGENDLVLKQSTRYPWDGKASIAVNTKKDVAVELCIRVPGWCQGKQSAESLYVVDGLPASGTFQLKINGRDCETVVSKGYAHINRTWKDGDTVEVLMDMPLRRVHAPRVPANKGLVALKRGPIVYAIEPVDKLNWIDGLYCPSDTQLSAEFNADLSGGVTVLNGELQHRTSSDQSETVKIQAIPYFSYLNRGPSEFRVWIPESQGTTPLPTLEKLATPSASHCNPSDSVFSMNDGVVHTNSSDHGKPRMSWWDHKGTTEWAQYEFPKEQLVNRVKIFWFADRAANGGCDLPEHWSLFYKRGADWVPVENVSGYSLNADQFNHVTFKPIKTSALRIEVKLKSGWSGGICQWEVE